MEYSEDKRQHIKWEIEAIKKNSQVAKETIQNKEALQKVLQDHNKKIKELENKLKSY